MKRYPLLVLLALAAVAAFSLVGKSETPATPRFDLTQSDLSAREKTIALKLTSNLLSKAVTFREDGTASSIVRRNNPTQIEWREFVVRQIIRGNLCAADQQRGVTRRFLAQIECKSYRYVSPATGNWTEWRSDDCPFLPSSIVIEQVDGRLTAHATDLAQFIPSPPMPATLPDSLMPAIGSAIAQR